jgi:hypothetical protein
MRRMLASFIKTKKTKAALEDDMYSLSDEPREILAKIGRVTYYRITKVKGVARHGHPQERTFKQLKRYDAKKVTHFTFELGWFDLDDTNYIMPMQSNSVKPLI